MSEQLSSDWGGYGKVRKGVGKVSERCWKGNERHRKVWKGTERYSDVQKGTERCRRYGKVKKGEERYRKVTEMLRKGTERY